MGVAAIDPWTGGIDYIKVKHGTTTKNSDLMLHAWLHENHGTWRAIDMPRPVSFVNGWWRRWLWPPTSRRASEATKNHQKSVLSALLGVMVLMKKGTQKKGNVHCFVEQNCGIWGGCSLFFGGIPVFFAFETTHERLTFCSRWKGVV